MRTLQKGNAWRRKVVLFLEAIGFSVTVRGIGFAGDDLRAVLGGLDLSIEAKDWKKYELASWVKQAEENAGEAVPVVFAHRNGRSEAKDGYVIMSGESFARLVRASRDNNDDSIDIIMEMSRGEE